MSTQLDLFSGVAFTSKKAYAEITVDGTKQSLRERVYDIIKTCGPVTRAEIEAMTGIRCSSVCGRVNELMKDNLIEGCGHKLDPQTKKTVTAYRIKSLS